MTISASQSPLSTDAGWTQFLALLSPAPGAPIADPAPAPTPSADAPPASRAKRRRQGEGLPEMAEPAPALAPPRDVTPEGVPVPPFTPWVPARSRAGGWSAAVQRAFIGELARIGSARAAAAAVGRTARSAYLLRRKPGAESFAAAWDAAVLTGIEQAEQTAISRALHGELVPDIHDGQVGGVRLRHNDRLLLSSLAAHHGRQAGRERRATLDEYRDQLERWEWALNARMLRIEAGGQFPEERRAEAWDAHVVWTQEVASEKKRVYRAEVRARLRAATKREAEIAAAIERGPRIRML